jgi:ribosomal protein S18 acetylase RimI-like enzyme
MYHNHVIFIDMQLNEQIKRIKSLMLENVKDYNIVTAGDLNSKYGMRVYIENLNGDLIGETNIIDFENGLKLSPNLTSFMDNKSEPFGMGDTVYQYSLSVEEPFRGQGWGEKLKQECHDIVRNLGYKYVTNIVRCDNHASQGLMKKLGYQKHQSNGERDVLYFEL